MEKDSYEKILISQALLNNKTNIDKMYEEMENITMNIKNIREDISKEKNDTINNLLVINKYIVDIAGVIDELIKDKNDYKNTIIKLEEKLNKENNIKTNSVQLNNILLQNNNLKEKIAELENTTDNKFIELEINLNDKIEKNLQQNKNLKENILKIENIIQQNNNLKENIQKIENIIEQNNNNLKENISKIENSLEEKNTNSKIKFYEITLKNKLENLENNFKEKIETNIKENNLLKDKINLVEQKIVENNLLKNNLAETNQSILLDKTNELDKINNKINKIDNMLKEKIIIQSIEKDDKIGEIITMNKRLEEEIIRNKNVLINMDCRITNISNDVDNLKKINKNTFISNWINVKSGETYKIKHGLDIEETIPIIQILLKENDTDNYKNIMDITMDRNYNIKICSSNSIEIKFNKDGIYTTKKGKNITNGFIKIKLIK